MTQEHPITPPPELVIEWWNQCTVTSDNLIRQFATQAARWGADMELDACCEFEATVYSTDCADKLRRHRRPKPTSLKELALQALDLLKVDASTHGLGFDSSVIRRALEQLDD